MTQPSINAIKAGIKTAIASFAVLFLTSLAGFLGELYKWSSSSGAEPLPKISTLGYAVTSAAIAAVTGLATSIVRALQGAGILPGKPPTYK